MIVATEISTLSQKHDLFLILTIWSLCLNLNSTVTWKNWELNPKKREVATKGNLKFHYIRGLTETYSCALSLNICLSKWGKRSILLRVIVHKPYLPKSNSVAIVVRLKCRFKQANYSCCNVMILFAPFTSKLQIFSLALMWRSADGEVTLMVLGSMKEVVSYQQEVWQYYLRRSLVQHSKCYPPLCPLTCYQTAELQRLVDQLISQWKKNQSPTTELFQSIFKLKCPTLAGSRFLNGRIGCCSVTCDNKWRVFLP